MIPKECKRLAEVDFPIAVVSRHSAREKSMSIVKAILLLLRGMVLNDRRISGSSVKGPTGHSPSVRCHGMEMPPLISMVCPVM